MVLDIMKKKAMKKKKGIQWGLYDRLEDLDFADDILPIGTEFQRYGSKTE
jgi:hypothetical protein